MSQIPQTSGTPPPAGALDLTLGHKTGETSEQVGGNQVKVTTTFKTFSVTVPVPAKGAGHPHVVCPVCNKKLRLSVPSAEAKRRWMIYVIVAMVAGLIAGIAILVGAEDFTEGPPFAALVLLFFAEIGLINLLIFVVDKEVWVATGNHKPLSSRFVAAAFPVPPVSAAPVQSAVPAPQPPAQSPATSPAPQAEGWGVAQFTPKARSPQAGKTGIALSGTQILILVLALMAAGAAAAYVLGRGGDDERAPFAVIPQAPAVATETFPVVPEESVVAPPQELFPIRARSEFIPLPGGCRADLTFKWVFDKAIAPPDGAAATVRVTGPQIGGTYPAEYRNAVASLTVQIGTRRGGDFKATLLHVGDNGVFGSPLVNNVFGC